MLCLLLLLLLLTGTGCHGQLVAALEERQVMSCIFWHDALGLMKGVSATGGVPLETCLARLGVSP